MSNRLLHLIAEENQSYLELQRINLEPHKVLIEPGDQVGLVYFPTSAVISILAVLSTGETIETVMLGKDGAIGAGAAINGMPAMHRAIVQLTGDALVCKSERLKTAVATNPLLLAIFMRHEQTVLAHAQQSAACLAVHQIQARMCRWLLRAQDLSPNSTLMLTQEFLAEMLGVRRTSIAMTASALQTAGLIEYSRGKVTIMDYDGLKNCACECYEEIKHHHDTLLNVVHNVV